MLLLLRGAFYTERKVLLILLSAFSFPTKICVLGVSVISWQPLVCKAKAKCWAWSRRSEEAAESSRLLSHSLGEMPALSLGNARPREDCPMKTKSVLKVALITLAAP